MKKAFLSLFTSFLITSSLLAQVPAYVPTNGLVGYWPFNGNANDESGNGNHGTVNGATLTVDRNGNANSAYSFDGVTSYIETIYPGPAGTGITASFWFKPNDLSFSCLIGYGGNSWGSVFEIMNNYWSAQTIGPCYGPAFHSFGTLVSPGFFDSSFINTWHFVNVVMPESLNDLNSIQFYIDGALTSSTCSFANYGAGSPSVGSNNPVRFGRNWVTNNGDLRFNGQLDDIAIYNRALTPSEISTIYTNSTNNTSSNNNNTYLNSVPSGISYQAVARSSQGTALANTVVQVRFTLITDSLSGNIEYVETHSLSTNSLGLFTTAFGTGTAVTGTWGGINWTHSNKYLKVELDTGNGFSDLGTQQLLSSPFAIRAQTAATIDNGSLPVYSNNAAAIAGGLTVGKLYRTSTGDLKVVF
jgi:hypothetical protein